MTTTTLEAGYYAFVIVNAARTLDDLFNSDDETRNAKAELAKSSSALITKDHPTVAGLFNAYKVMADSWILVLLGDRDCRADTPGEAYAMLGAKIPDVVTPFVVMHMVGLPPTVLH